MALALLSVFVAAWWLWKKSPAHRKNFANFRHNHVERQPKLNAETPDPQKAPSERSPAQTRSSPRREAPEELFERQKPERLNPQESIRTELDYSRQSRDPDYQDENGNSYYLLENLRAVKKTGSNQNDYPDAVVQNGHFILEGSPGAGNSWVMRNAKTNEYAVFTGVVKAKLVDLAVIDQVVAGLQYSVDQVYDPINVVFYKFNTYGETIAAYRALTQDPQVIRANIELLEYQRVAK